jgi:hypothetical protein
LLAGGAYDSAVLNKKAKHSQCRGVSWNTHKGKWQMWLLFPLQFRPQGGASPKADGTTGVDVVPSAKALDLPHVKLGLTAQSESEACMAWDYCLGNARLLGLHSPQRHAYTNPIGKFIFAGASKAMSPKPRNYDDVTHVEYAYHRVLPVDLYSRLHKCLCVELLMARGRAVSSGW